MAKRTGKTHENLENEITPPPTVRTPSSPVAASRTRASSDVVRGRVTTRDHSGPISVSGGDFATPTSRRRTTTQPRGLPVIKVPVEPPAEPPADIEAKRDGAPQPQISGALPEAPFAAPTSGELGDSANRLAAEAAAVRAFDSGPLTPPPEVLLGAGQAELTPPPLVTSADEPPIAPLVEGTPEDSSPPSPPIASVAPSLTSDTTGATFAEAFGAQEPVSPVAENDFTATETPWPELGDGRGATPTPGAIPTDAMGGDSGRGATSDQPPKEAPAFSAGASAMARVNDEHEVAGVDDLLVDDAAEVADALETLPPEALADPEISGPVASAPAVPPPAPRVPTVPPPPPAGPPPRRKTGEIRGPEVPTAQVVASLVPELSPGAPPLPEALAQRPRRPKRSKPWFEEVFDEDYLRTLPFMSGEQTLREVEFIEASLAARPGARILDIGCGYGRHAIELVQRGLDVTGLDLSLPLLIRAADEAQKRALSVNFVHADMREMAFNEEFDGVTCMLTSFGYFDEDANMRVAENIARALKPGGRFLLDLVNRDYIVGDLPSRVWWEGNGCVVLEEVDFNFHTSRILTHRSIVFEDGRQLEQELSIRAYSLHEIGRLLRQAGFRVIDISGGLATRGQFFGSTSRNLMILSEKRTDEG
ncbi:MAG: Methyltransferase type 11 [Myxococcales bacterium]|nr:Methyltransferase type 11 [Myxococcales bacterium]